MNKKQLQRKKLKKKIIAVVLMFTILAVIMVTGTYAKFTKTFSGSDTGIVAKFKVMSNVNTASFDIFSTIYENASTGEIDEDVIDGKIAPGTQGKFTVTVQNDSEVYVDYSLNLSLGEGSNAAVPLEYSYDGVNYYNINLFNSMFSQKPGKRLNYKSEEISIPIYWRWPYEANDSFDSSLVDMDDVKVVVVASVTFTQADAAVDNYVEVAAIPNLRKDIESAVTVSSMLAPNYANQSWGYDDYADAFAGKTISRIDFPVKTVTDLDNAYITMFVTDNNYKTTNAYVGGNQPTKIAEYKIHIPKEQLGNSTTVNKWVSVTGLNISIGENQRIAFGDVGDTAKWGCIRIATAPTLDPYSLIQDILSTKAASTAILAGYAGAWDVYVKEEPKLDKVLAGQTISILGDSISTYAGVSDDANLGYSTHAAWYKSSNISSYGMSGVNDTWWMQTINNNNMVLKANNSWGGAFVIDGKNADGESTDDPQNSGMIRAEYLGSSPNIIAVMMGANDIIKAKSDPGTFDAATYASVGTEITDSTVFLDAYSVMAKRLQKFYPGSNIFLFTIVPASRFSSDAATLEKYNDVIRGIANYSSTDNLHLVDLSTGGMTPQTSSSYFGSDGIHPNAQGMDYITEVFESSLKDFYGIN